jgi:SET domain-containing protein
MSLTDPLSASGGGVTDGEMVFSINKWISDCKDQDTQAKVQLLNDDGSESNPEITVSDTTIVSLPLSLSLFSHCSAQLDCRVYRNVGSFVRQSNTTSSVNVIRKIAFIDQTNYQYPRLVLYAARDIRSGEEILLSK